MIQKGEKKRLVRGIIKAIGDNPFRAGLRKTPERVLRSWTELFAGYDQDPAEILSSVFDEHDNYDQLIMVKDIEFFSTCEHHLLPFYGRALVAYLPAEDSQVVGVSKLARLLDCFARRLQIQERIGQQVTQALEEYLDIRGAACILEAKHMCMASRGVRKFNSVMVTSSVTGDLRHNESIKAELMALSNVSKGGF